MEVSMKEGIEQDIQDINLQSTSKFTFKNIIDIFNVEKLLEHKIFLMFILIAVIGVGFIIWRSFMKKPTSIDEEDNEKGTQEMMDELGVNLTKNAMGEHMTSESDKDEESEDENSIGEGDNDNHVDTLSNDLNELEVYTQNSIDS